ncbi:MAG: hypothetical protein HOW97_00360 [Catenulispora sp.]|nr:hypothetical protein [Catenulispora sp.]
MSDVGEQLEAVLARRRRSQPAIEAEIAGWEQIRTALVALGQAVAAADPEELVAAGLGDLDPAALERLAEEAQAELRTVRARVNRRTVNIGVSGQARNGKSTLLQKMSKLEDDQIPTGAGGAVTAVRSRIFNSDGEPEAILTMHTEVSFETEVLAPYATELELPPPLATLDGLAQVDFAALDKTLQERPNWPYLRPMLSRLREMRDSVATFRPLLTGRSRHVELADLRAWVAYPKDPPATNDAHDGHSEHSGPDGPDHHPVDRRYLAVRDAEIHCPFPSRDVASLGLIDLPGLGELVPEAEKHHLAGLQNDVDYILVVKWPQDGNQMWRPEDAKALTLIDQARGAAASRDFSAVLVNTGLVTAERLTALENDLKRVNSGVDDSAVRVLYADVSDPDDVTRNVLEASLAHLAQALPRMDAAAFEQAGTVTAARAAAIGTAVTAAQAALRTVVTPTPYEILDLRAKDLRESLAGALRAWTADLEKRARDDSGYEDLEFLEHADAIREGIREWILDGFGEGVEGWTGRLYASMTAEYGGGQFIHHELNSVRTAIADRFAGIDDVLAERLRRFRADLVGALSVRLGPLLAADGDPAAALRELADRLGDATDPCPTLRRALEFVLDIHLDYRTRTLPRIRQALVILLPAARSGAGGALESMPSVEHSPAGAHELFVWTSQLARAAVHDGARVLADEPSVIAQALLAYGEQFEDAFIRSDAAMAEFRRLAESFRDQLWPTPDSGPGLANARIQRIRTTLKDVASALADSADRQGAR